MRVIKPFIRIVTLAAVIFIASGCANHTETKDEVAGPIEISLKEYYKNARKYDGKEVTAAGYLISQQDVLHLDESSDRPLKVNAPRMLIWDSTPSTEIGLDVIHQSHQCTDQYVKITGILGQIPDVDIFGMVEISEIRVFKDGAFHGQNEVCYTKN